MASNNADNACEIETGALLANNGEEVIEIEPRRGLWGAKLALLLTAAGALVLTAAGGAFFAGDRLALKVHGVTASGGPAGLISKEGVCGLGVCPVGQLCVVGVCQVSAALPTPIPGQVPGQIPVAPAVGAPVLGATDGTVPCAKMAKSVRSNSNKRPEALHDGNVCRDSEELFGGLCYRKCSDFTELGFDCTAKRISAFQCCNGLTTNCDDPLAFVSADIASFEPCTGFAVSAANANTACPHLPGACLENEEQQMGQCFKKCTLLTGGALPYRCAPMTCTSVNPATSILGPLDCVAQGTTDAKYMVGGGAGDGDASTPADAHFPSTEETEAKEA